MVVKAIGYTILGVFFGLLIFSEVRPRIEGLEAKPEIFTCYDFDQKSSYYTTREELNRVQRQGAHIVETRATIVQDGAYYSVYVPVANLVGCIEGEF